MSAVVRRMLGELGGDMGDKWTAAREMGGSPEESRECEIAREILKVASGLVESPAKWDIIKLATELKQMHAAPKKKKL